MSRHRPRGSPLTPRQKDVLELLLQGASNKVIGVKLGISHLTVNQHAQAVFQVYGVHSRMALLIHVTKERM